MKYWAIKDENGVVVSFGTTNSPIKNHEITKAEYETIQQETEVFCGYVDTVYRGETAIEDVPEEIRERVAAEVAKREEAASQPRPMEDIDEALAILSGEVSEND